MEIAEKSVLVIAGLDSIVAEIERDSDTTATFVLTARMIIQSTGKFTGLVCLKPRP